MNNSRFKFRVFSRIEQKMFYSQHPPYLSLTSDSFIMHLANYNINEMIAPIDPENTCILMQCLEKKDINENLIFEGDLLWSDDGEDSYLILVKWNDKYCRFELLSANGYNENGLMEFDNLEYQDDLFESIELFEIAGNIYQNHELLKEN